MSWNDNFSTLFELLPIGAYRTDARSRQVRANQAMVRIFGFETEEEMLTTNKSRAEGWYAQPARRAEFRALLETQGSVRNFESEMRRHGTGETFWISENAHAVRDEAGNVLYHEGTIEDITERVRATQALQLTLDNAGRGIVQVDADGTVVLYNRRLLELLDLSEQLMATRPRMRDVIRFQEERGDFAGASEFIGEEARQAYERDTGTGASDVLTNSGHYLRRTRSGLVIEVTTQPLPDGGMVRTYSDVTAYVTAQQQLAEKSRALQITLDSMSQGILSMDTEERVVMWNRRFLELSGFDDVLLSTRPKLQHLLELQIARGDFGPDFKLVDQAARSYVAQNVPPVRGPVSYMRKTPDGHSLEVRTQPLPDGGVVRTYTDMTDYAAAQDALMAAKEAAEAGERAKAEFLANMSHEIRTPMNAVIGMSDLLLDSPLSAQQKEFAESIRTSGDALLTLINDILDFSKIESGHLTLEHVPVNLAECVEGALDIASRPAADKGLDLLYWIEDEVPRMVLGDATRLRQVFVNLISNAVKFTQHGEVVVTLSRREGADGQVMLHGSVRDTGIGIPADRVHRLFQVFSQVDASTTRQFGGTGLGLAICRRLVELMGGRIWVESRAGEGSDFQFEVPCESANGPVPFVSRQPANLAGRQLLIVDDNAANRTMLTLQTRRWGMQTQAAIGGEQALQWIDAGQPFDAAILDVQMPGMDGYALLAELRRRPATADLPVLVLTSVGAGNSRPELDIAQTLSKPVKSNALFQALVALFEQPSSQPAPLAPEPATKAKPRLAHEYPLRLLVAEDNIVNQRVAELLLKGMGYEIQIVENGQLALDAVAAARERGQPFDVVLLDVQMPVLDGLAASRRLSEQYPDPAQRPWIVAMTANAMLGDREECIAAGMDDYLSKPIRPPGVASALKQAWAQLAERRG